MYHGKRKMGRWSETMVGFMMACIGCCGFCGLFSSIGCDHEVCGSWPIVLCSGYLLLRLGFSLTEMTSPKSWLIARREQPIVLEKALLWNRSNQCPHCVVCHWLVSVSPVGGQPESWSITALDSKRASWNLCKLSSTSLLISYLFNVPHTLDSIVVAWSGGGAVSEIVYIKSQFSFFFTFLQLQHFLLFPTFQKQGSKISSYQWPLSGSYFSTPESSEVPSYPCQTMLTLNSLRTFRLKGSYFFMMGREQEFWSFHRNVRPRVLTL